MNVVLYYYLLQRSLPLLQWMTTIYRLLRRRFVIRHRQPIVLTCNHCRRMGRITSNPLHPFGLVDVLIVCQRCYHHTLLSFPVNHLTISTLGGGDGDWRSNTGCINIGRFFFRNINDLPPPEAFTNSKKSYLPKGGSSGRKNAPDAPPNYL